MEKRKLIGCIINCPENFYQQRILDGLLARCELYGYDLATFCPLVNSVHFYKDFLRAEFNILELMNFELLDAVVVVSLPLVGMGDKSAFDQVSDLLKRRCKKPVICLDLPMADYETIYTDDATSFSAITSHVLDVHGCKNIYFLAGFQSDGIVDQRLKGFKDEMARRGLPVDENKIFFGDFWYTSGTALANRIISGELEMPDAVICGSDHMAIGLTNALVAAGISVPDQVIVTGYDATQEAIVNEVSVTSYTPDNKGMAEKAVDRIREILEPDKPLAVTKHNPAEGMFIGLSCGCPVDHKHLIHTLSRSLYKLNRDFGDETIHDNEDLYRLTESYMLEALTETKSPEECLGSIGSQTYLIRPFDSFFLCLRENWLDTDTVLTDGYPATVRTNIRYAMIDGQHVNPENYHCDDDRERFDTKLMLHELHRYHNKPYVYYFLPVHFQNNTLGFAVLQCEAARGVKPTGVLRNWMRNVYNALQMTRVNHRLQDFSEIDKMTGLKNRRGMENGLKELFQNANKSDLFYAVVFDLDGLKYINDNYGHTEGDFAITSVASAVAKVTESREISIRAGGDEFYLIGVGAYCTEKTLIDKISNYRRIIGDINRSANKPYEIAASVGFSMKRISELTDINEVICEADKYMYLCKQESKRRRR